MTCLPTCQAWGKARHHARTLSDTHHPSLTKATAPLHPFQGTRIAHTPLPHSSRSPWPLAPRHPPAPTPAAYPPQICDLLTPEIFVQVAIAVG